MMALIAGATWCAAWWAAIWLCRPHPLPTDDEIAWFIHVRLYGRWEVGLLVARLTTLLFVLLVLLALLVNINTGSLVLDSCYLKDWGPSSC